MQRVELLALPPPCGVWYLKTASLSSINSPLCPKSSSGRGVGMQILAKWKWIHFHTPHSWPGGQPANRACMSVWHRDKCSLEHRLKPPNWYHMGHQPNSDLALCRWVAVELTRYGFLLQLGWWSGFFFFKALFEYCRSPHSTSIYQPQNQSPGLPLWAVGSYLALRNRQTTRFLLIPWEGRAAKEIVPKLCPGWQALWLALWASVITICSFCILLFYIFLPLLQLRPSSLLFIFFFVSNPYLFRASNILSFSWIQGFNLACGVLALPASCFGHYFQLEGIKRQRGAGESEGAGSQRQHPRTGSASHWLWDPVWTRPGCWPQFSPPTGGGVRIRWFLRLVSRCHSMGLTGHVKSILGSASLPFLFVLKKLSCSMDEWGDVSRVPKLGFSNAEYGRESFSLNQFSGARDKEEKKKLHFLSWSENQCFPPGSQSDSSGICCFLEIRFLYCNRSMYTCERKIVLLEGKG